MLSSKQLEFARQFIEQIVVELEERARVNEFNWYCMRHAVALAHLLEREELVTRIVTLWQIAVERFGKEEVGGLGENKTIAELQQRYTTYPKDALPTMTRTMAKEKQISLCLEHRYIEAYESVSNDFDLETVVATQAVLGDFDAAWNNLERISDERKNLSRQMLTVITLVEKFRRGEMENFQTQLQTSEAELQLWDYIHLARGFAGFEPWDGYPYADY